MITFKNKYNNFKTYECLLLCCQDNLNDIGLAIQECLKQMNQEKDFEKLTKLEVQFKYLRKQQQEQIEKIKYLEKQVYGGNNE